MMENIVAASGLLAKRFIDNANYASVGGMLSKRMVEGPEKDQLPAWAGLIWLLDLALFAPFFVFVSHRHPVDTGTSCS